MLVKPLFNKQALKTLAFITILIYFTTGLLLAAPESRAEEIQGDFQLVVGQYRGLTQQLSVPINVRNANGLAALEFIIASESVYHIDVAVEGVERGADLPADATITWSGTGHGDVKIGIYFYQQLMYGQGELVRINYNHTGTEQTYGQMINLRINDDPKHITVRAIDEAGGEGQIFGDGWETKYLTLNSGTLVDGFINVDIMYGDMDKSEDVSINDALLALRASIGDLELTPQLMRAGDVKRLPGTNASRVTVHDALLIARKAVGLIDFFPVSPDPETGESKEDSKQSPFTLQPSSIWIGDYQLSSLRTVVGGDVTFTVKFPQRITGDVKLEISGPRGTATNTEFINNATEVDITVDMIGKIGGGEKIVSAYQYNTITKEQGIPLGRFVYLVDKEVAPPLTITGTRNRELDFEWPATDAAKSITIRQSLDNSAWVDARTARPILSTDNSTTITNLDPRRSYYFKLMVDYGVHAGESAVIRYNRMTENAIAYQIDDHMVVSVLYTGPLVDLNQSAYRSFFMVGQDQSKNEFKIHPDNISLRSNKKLVLIFLNNTQEDFLLVYSGAPGLLDNDASSYVLQNDSVRPSKAEPLSELVVTSQEELKYAVENMLAETIILGNDITADSINIKWPLELDGAGYTLNSDITIDAVDVIVKNLYIDSSGDTQIEVNEDARFHDVSFTGDGTASIRTAPGKTLILNGTITIEETATVTLDGAQLAGNSATITGPEGSSLIFANGANAARNLNLTGGLLVTVEDNVKLEDVIIDADMEVKRGIEFINNVSLKKVTIRGPSASFTGDVTVNRLILQNNLQLNGKLGFTGSQAALSGGNKRLAGQGTVELRSSGINVEAVTFGTGIMVDIIAAANFSAVTFDKELVSANTGNSFSGCTFKEKLVISAAGTFTENTYAGGELEINRDNITIAGDTFTANVTVAGSGNGVSFEDVTFEGTVTSMDMDTVRTFRGSEFRGDLTADAAVVLDDVTVTADMNLNRTEAVSLTGDLTISDGRTLTLQGNVELTGNGNTIKGPGTLTAAGGSNTMRALSIEAQFDTGDVDTILTDVTTNRVTVTHARAMTINPSVTAPASWLLKDDVTLDGVLSLEGTGVIAGEGGTESFSPAAAEIVTVDDDLTFKNLIFGGDVDIVGSGNAEFEGCEIAGVVTVAAGGEATFNNVAFDNYINNAGSVTLAGDCRINGVVMANATYTTDVPGPAHATHSTATPDAPTDVVAGEVQEIVFTFKDEHGNAVKADETVALSLTDLEGDIGSLNPTTDTEGKVTVYFSSENAATNNPGTVSAELDGVTKQTSTLTVVAAVVTSINITQQPIAPASNGAVLASQPELELVDEFDNVCATGVSATATVIPTATGGTWTLGTTATDDEGGKEAVAGLVTFDDLTATSDAAVPLATITFTVGNVTVESVAFAIPEPPLSGTVAIDGTLKYDQGLTANISALVGNVDVETLSYQWKRNGIGIGANAATYTTVEADIGETISVDVTSSAESGTITGTAGDVIALADGPAAPEGLALELQTVDFGRITSTLATQEISVDSGLEWIDATADNTDLTEAQRTSIGAGTDAVRVRVKETATHLAGTAANIEVIVGPDAPTFTGAASGTPGTLSGLPNDAINLEGCVGTGAWEDLTVTGTESTTLTFAEFDVIEVRVKADGATLEGYTATQAAT